MILSTIAWSSFAQQLSVLAGDVSHVLEVWLTHIVSPGGFTGQGGCHAHWAHGRGRCAAGVQGPEQEVLFIVSFSIWAAHSLQITAFHLPLISAGAYWCFFSYHSGFVDFSCSCARTSACRSWCVWLLQSPLLVSRRPSASSRCLCRKCWCSILYPGKKMCFAGAALHHISFLPFCSKYESLHGLRFFLIQLFNQTIDNAFKM